MNQVTVFKTLFARELDRLKTEIGLYKDETHLWQVAAAISNSGGNLCLHLIGNLNTYIGDALAHSGYVRQRDLEFSQKNIPASVLLEMIEETKEAVAKGFDSLKEEDLHKDFPVIIWQQPFSTFYTVSNLLWHMGYHLGQINYHRRLLDQ